MTSSYPNPSPVPAPSPGGLDAGDTRATTVAAAPYNVLAIVAFVSAFVLPIVPIVLGFVARSQIRARHDRGAGLALAAIILGIAFVALSIIGVVVSAIVVATLPEGAAYDY